MPSRGLHTGGGLCASGGSELCREPALPPHSDASVPTILLAMLCPGSQEPPNITSQLGCSASCSEGRSGERSTAGGPGPAPRFPLSTPTVPEGGAAISTPQMKKPSLRGFKALGSIPAPSAVMGHQGVSCWQGTVFTELQSVGCQ